MNAKRRMVSASYTVEASYVMAIVIFALAVLIQTAYSRCRTETGILRLQHAVEMVRGQGDEKVTQFTVAGMNGFAERTDKAAEGRITGNGWQKEISVNVHKPEAFMRMLTIFQSDGEGEQINANDR